MSNPINTDNEAAVVAHDKTLLENGGRAGEPSMFTCPDCGGVLWELNERDLLRYRCHVGHTYTAEGLRSEQSEALEEALWTAIRSLEESASLARRLAYRARKGNNPISAEHFEARAEEDEGRAELVRRALWARPTPVTDSEVLDDGARQPSAARAGASSEG